MALDISGQGGELRQGRRQLARLATFRKVDRRVFFEVASVNPFAAGLGPPTDIVVPVAAHAVRVYPVVAGTLESGVVDVDLLRARTETTTT